MGKKVKTHEMLEMIYQRVRLKGKFNNGGKWRDSLTQVTLNKLSKTKIEGLKFNCMASVNVSSMHLKC